jgi:hypothetical protein
MFEIIARPILMALGVAEHEVVAPSFVERAYGHDSWLVPWTPPISDGTAR